MPDDRAGATQDEQVVLLQAESSGSSEDHRRLSGWSDGTLASDDDASFNKETRLIPPGGKAERPSSSLLSGRRHPGRTGWQKLLRVTLAASAISLILGAVYMKRDAAKVLRRSCSNPYFQPGYLYRGATAHDVHWITYDLNKENLGHTLHPDSMQLNVSQELWPSASEEFSAQTMVSFPNMLIDTAARGSDPRLQWLRGKRVGLLGSSLDKVFGNGFCGMVPASEYTHDIGWQTSTCSIPDLNFTVFTFYSYGLHDDDYYPGPYGDAGVITLEQRIDKAYAPLFKSLGFDHLDMIILSADLWDLKYLRYLLRVKEGREKKDSLLDWYKEPNSPIPPDFLEWRTGRLQKVVSHIHEVWPQTKLVFRLGTYTNTLDGKNANVEQLNQHSTAVLQRLGIPLLPWSYLVRGEPETSYADPIHFHGISQPNWVYAQLMMHYLREAENPAGLFCH